MVIGKHSIHNSVRLSVDPADERRDMSSDDSSDVGCRASGRTLIQTVNGCSELPDDPTLITFTDPPKPEAWEIVLVRLRAENEALADVRCLIQAELKRIRAERTEPSAQPKSLKKREAAARLSISIKRLFALRDRGEIEVVRNGKTGAQLFPVASLDAWLRENAERL